MDPAVDPAVHRKNPPGASRKNVRESFSGKNPPGVSNDVTGENRSESRTMEGLKSINLH